MGFRHRGKERSIPNKAMGVLAIGLVFGSLLALPWVSAVQVGSGKFRLVSEWWYWTFLADVFLLTWVGAMEITPSTVWLGQVCTVYLFVYLLVVLPLVGWLESVFYTEA